MRGFTFTRSAKKCAAVFIVLVCGLSFLLAALLQSERAAAQENAGRYDVSIVHENFEEGIDEDVWRASLPTGGEIRNTSPYEQTGIVFYNTVSSGENIPKLILRGSPFSATDSDTVFDIQFTARIYPHTAPADYRFGLMFGMPSEDATFNQSNAICLTNLSATVYKKGVYQSNPTYVTKDDEGWYGTDESRVYIGSAPLTVRLVGKKDGTLELYRGQYYSDGDFVVSTDINKLYATYSGFDFSGYIAFFTDGTLSPDRIAQGSYVSMYDVSVAGSVLYDESDVIRGVTLESDFSDLRYIAGMAPVEIKARVNSVPNLPQYGDWTAQVVDGPARIDEDGKLVLTGTGDVTLRITSDYNNAVYEDFKFTVNEALIGFDFQKERVRGLVAGESVNLDASVYTIPESSEYSSDVVYSIQSGADVASVDGDTLTTLKAGKATLRITSVQDETKYQDFEFEVSDQTRCDYRLVENFQDTLVPEDWTVMNAPEGSVSANGGLMFRNAYSDAQSNTYPKAVFNIAFTNNPLTGVVFDVTFTARQGSRTGIPFGFMFGMPDQNANFNSPGVGSIIFTSTWANVYMGGELQQPHYVTTGTGNEWYGHDDGFAYIHDLPLTVRLVGKENGTLELYMGMSYEDYSVEIDKLFATYDDMNIEGFVGFFSNVAADHGAYSATIRNLTLGGNFLYDEEDCEVTRITVNEDALTGLLYTPQPIDVGVQVFARPNLSVFREYTLTVEEGPAYIDEQGMLQLTGPGKVKIRYASVTNPAVFGETTFEVGELIISSITIDKTKFESVTTDSQPIDLIATMVCNTYLPKYQNVIFTVVSGNAEIVGKQLRITGSGPVVLRATAESQPDKYEEFTFNVADADAQYQPAGTGGGCNSSAAANAGWGALLLFLAAGIALFKKKA